MKTIKRATLGRLEGIGTTKHEAAANLDKQIHWLADNADNTKIESNFGLVGILTPHAEGWSYTIVEAAAVPSGMKSYHGTCSFGTRAYTDALSTMRNAMCQRAWTPAVNDSDHIAAAKCLDSDARELASLFAAYRKQDAAA